MRNNTKILWLLTLFLVTPLLHAQIQNVCGCSDPEHAHHYSDLVVKGKVVSEECRMHKGGIETCYSIEVESVISGEAPEKIAVVTRGGKIGRVEMTSSDAMPLDNGQTYQLFLKKRDDGLYVIISYKSGEDAGAASNGPAPNGVSETGYLENSDGIPARFLAADENKPIHYVVDADALPNGITQEQALQAVRNAFAAWSADSSLTFIFDGLQSFGQPATTFPASDSRIYVQLHDTYGLIESPSLGFGGRFTENFDYDAAGGGGGIVGPQVFHKSVKGHLVMNHTEVELEDLDTFSAVLTHEIGHALGLDHSSEDQNETDPVLKNAIMYFELTSDNDGATLTSYDKDCIKLGYPVTNRPPFAHSTLMNVLSPNPGIVGTNQVTITAGDFDTPSGNLSVELLDRFDPNEVNNGTATLNGNVLNFTAAGLFENVALTAQQVADGFYFHRERYRVFDGVNYSPIYIFRVYDFDYDNAVGEGLTQEEVDETGGGRDGIPTTWINTHFGVDTIDATADPDGDGLSNLREYQLGTDPNVANGASSTSISNTVPASLTLSTTPYIIHEIQSSTDLQTWKTERLILPLGGQESVQDLLNGQSKGFLRVIPRP